MRSWWPRSLLVFFTVGCAEPTSDELHQAARRGDLASVEALLEAGARIDGRDRDGSTALYWAAGTGRLDVAATLLDHGADVEAVFRFGGAPMHAAAIGRHAEMVELLARYGGRVDGPEWSGVTPLQAAADAGQAPLVLLMCGLRRGATEVAADPTAEGSARGRGQDEDSPTGYPDRDFASFSQRIVAQAVPQMEVVQALVDEESPRVLRLGGDGFGRLSMDAECRFASVFEQLDGTWTELARYQYRDVPRTDSEIWMRHIHGRTLAIVDGLASAQYLLLKRYDPEYGTMAIAFLELWVETLEMSRVVRLSPSSRPLTAALEASFAGSGGDEVIAAAETLMRGWAYSGTAESAVDDAGLRALDDLQALRVSMVADARPRQRLSFALAYLELQTRYTAHRLGDRALLDLADRVEALRRTAPQP